MRNFPQRRDGLLQVLQEAHALAVQTGHMQHCFYASDTYTAALLIMPDMGDQLRHMATHHVSMTDPRYRMYYGLLVNDVPMIHVEVAVYEDINDLTIHYPMPIGSTVGMLRFMLERDWRMYDFFLHYADEHDDHAPPDGQPLFHDDVFMVIMRAV